MGNSLEKKKEIIVEGASQSRTSLAQQRRISKAATAADSSGLANPRLTLSQREIIRQIWGTAKRTEFCTRIFKRVFEQRPDFQLAFDSISRDTWIEEARHFADFMTAVVDQLVAGSHGQGMTDFQNIEKMSVGLGYRYGKLRSNGFKSEFWVVFAESMAMECVYLDAGAHPTPDVFSAWSTLLSLVLGWVRDGYYEKLRNQRRLDKSWRFSANSANSSGRSLSDSGSRTSSLDEPPR